MALSVVAAVGAVAVGVYVAVADDGPSEVDAVPASMAALGDSITVAYNACGLLQPCERVSWATGTDPGIDSHYQRLLARGPAIRDQASNLAVPGAKIADLDEQAAAAVEYGAEYVTVLIGANDACTGSEESMTSVADYRSRLDGALEVLRNGVPEARLLLVSIPDVYRLWEIDNDDLVARAVWDLAGICQSMLADPTSDAPDDDARRQRVRERVVEFNRQLAEACTAYGDRCRYDGGAVFDEDFESEDLSAIDHFHPSRQGQITLAAVADAAGYQW